MVQKIERFQGLVDEIAGTAHDLSAAERQALKARAAPLEGAFGVDAKGDVNFDFQFGRITEGARAGEIGVYDPPFTSARQFQGVIGALEALGRLMATAAAESSGSLRDYVLDQTSQAIQMIQYALHEWSRVADVGLASNIRIAIADLPAGELGRATITHLDASGAPSEARIVLDWNGDGHGWFVDATPLDASEFADPNSAAAGHYDLFSVISHEVGHALGFLAGFDGYDRYVQLQPGASPVFAAPGIHAVLANDGSHLGSTLYAADLMADQLGLFERKLPSPLSTKIIAAARSGAAGSGSDQEVGLPAAALGAALPVGLVNGTFDVVDVGSPVFGWQAFGSASVVNGRGVLSEASPIAPRFTQNFTVPAGARFLRFTLNDVDFDPAGNGPQDAFEVALLDPSSSISLFGGLGLAGTDAALNLQADGSVYSAAGVRIDGLDSGHLPAAGGALTVTISLAGIAAQQDVSLYFDLLGFGAHGSQVVFDDVKFLFDGGNRAPSAVNDAYTLDEDTTLAFDVRSNDNDPDGDALSVSFDSAPVHGAVTLQPDGALRYTPDSNFSGSDSFSYRVSDGLVSSGAATVTLTVRPVNDAPVARDDASATDEDTPLVLEVRGNDSDADGDVLTVSIITAPAHGALTLQPDGTLRYTPDIDFNGGDSFGYQVSDGTLSSNPATVTITVMPVNDAPVALTDTAVTSRNRSVTIDVLANDTDVETGPLIVSIVGNPTHGTVVLTTADKVVYTPDAGYAGADSFSYRASDGALFSNPASVAITVNAANSAPVAVNDSFATDEDTPLVFDMRLNDSDAETGVLVATVQSAPQHGRVVARGDGAFEYVPDANYNGADSFTYRVSDGALDSNIATVNLTVRAIDDAPVLSPIADQQVNEGQTLTLALTASDVDAGDTLVFSLDSAPAGATLTPAGQLSWTAPDGPASASFTVRVRDQAGASSLQTFQVAVVNLPPQVQASGAATVNVGQTFELTMAYTDPGADTVTAWSIDWGDGTTTVAPGAQTRASHVFSQAAAALSVTVRAQDDDGEWIANTLTLRVLALVPTPTPTPAPDNGHAEGRGNTGDQHAEVRDDTHTVEQEREHERQRDVGNAVPATVLGGSTRAGSGSSGNAERNRHETALPRARYSFEGGNFSSDGMSVSITSHSAHPFVQAIGFAVVEGRAGQLASGPLTGEQMASLLESSPTAAGPADALQVRSVIVTANGVHVRFNQVFDSRVLLAGATQRPPITLKQGERMLDGHVVLDPDGQGFAFLVDGGLLPDGAYTVRLSSGPGGFAKPNGEALDGEYDGKAGGDYLGRFDLVGAALRLGLNDALPVDGAGAGLVRLGLVGLNADLEGTGERWSAETDTPLDSVWGVLIGGVGGVATLAARAVADSRLARRALAAGRRSAPAAEFEAPIEIKLQVKPETASAQHRSPEWMARWLGRGKASGNNWRIRL